MRKKYFFGSFTRNKKIILIFISGLLLLLGTLGYFYRAYIKPASDSFVGKNVYGNENASIVGIPLTPGLEIEQAFTTTVDTINGVSLQFLNASSSTETKIGISLLDKKTGQILYYWDWLLEKSNEMKYMNIVTDADIPLKIDTVYIIRLYVQQGDGTAFVGKLKEGDHLYIDGDESNGEALACKVMLKHTRVYFYFFLAVVLGLILLWCITCFVIGRQMTLQSCSVLMGLIIGIIYMFIIPPYAAPDESAHIATTYHFSNQLVGSSDLDAGGNVIIRAEDTYRNGDSYPTKGTYAIFFKGALGDHTMESVEARSTRQPLDISVVGYLPQVTGVTLARILQLNGEQLLLLGRFFALLFNLFLVFWAIKIIPFGKMIIFSISLLPMYVQQAMSFSYDSLVNSISLLVISWFVRLIYEQERVMIKDVIFLLTSVVIVAPIKVIYIVIWGLGILIPYQKFGSKVKKWWMAVMLAAAGVCSVILNRLTSITSLMVHSSGVRGIEGLKGYSVSELIINPFNTAFLYIGTCFENMSFYLSSMIGNFLGWLEIKIPDIIIIGFVLVLLLSVWNTKELRIKVNVRHKIWMLFLSLVCIILACTAMLLDHTLITSPIIEGVQGRYFLPVLPLILLALANKNIEIKRDIKYYLMTAISILQIYTVLGIVAYVFARQ